MTEEEKYLFGKAWIQVCNLRDALRDLCDSDNVLVQEVVFDLLEKTIPIQNTLTRLK